ncbi:MAG TPA: hypothetical protein VFS43_38670 [Polyangiaceae bacterium]|nr:hypothetical protein [Polyangiaceae bacterium]
MSEAPRRRLPVLGAGTPPTPDEERPPWHWSGIGAVLTFSFWLPLAWAGALLSQRWLARLIPGEGPEAIATFLGQASGRERALIRASLVAPGLLSCFASAALAGFIVGRFGGKAGPKEAAVGGLVAGTFASALAAAGEGGGLVALLWLWPPIAGLGLLGGYLGGRLGRRRREGEGAALTK